MTAPCNGTDGGFRLLVQGTPTQYSTRAALHYFLAPLVDCRLVRVLCLDHLLQLLYLPLAALIKYLHAVLYPVVVAPDQILGPLVDLRPEGGGLQLPLLHRQVMIDGGAVFQALPLDALRLILLVEVTQMQQGPAIGQLAGVREAQARLCQQVAPPGKVGVALAVHRRGRRVPHNRSGRCQSLSLVELGLLHDGNLDVSDGAVTANLLRVPLGAVQGLAESLIILDELTTLGQDVGLVLTTLRNPHLFKLFLIPLGSGPSHVKILGLPEVVRYCGRLDGTEQLINQLAGICLGLGVR